MADTSLLPSTNIFRRRVPTVCIRNITWRHLSGWTCHFCVVFTVTRAEVCDWCYPLQLEHTDVNKLLQVDTHFNTLKQQQRTCLLNFKLLCGCVYRDDKNFQACFQFSGLFSVNRNVSCLFTNGTKKKKKNHQNWPTRRLDARVHPPQIG